MRAPLAWVALALLAAPGCSPWVRIAPGDARLQYSGRMDWRDPAGPRFSHTGTSVAARVESGEPSALRIHLRDVPRPWQDTGRLEASRYELLIDGASAGILVAGPEELHTVRLEAGEHVVELFKRTEPAVGRGQLLGLELPRQARLLAPPERPRRRIELVGDSGTTGYGNAGTGPDCPFSADTEDGYRSFAVLAGRLLRAEIHVVAWHGRGVVRNYDLSTTETVPQMYGRALPEDPTSRWDFSRWTPDAVVIALGANDFVQPGLDVAAFERGYLAFLAEVRRRYPRAFILCVYPGITDDWPVGARHGTLSREAMDRIVGGMIASGDTRVQGIAFEPAAPEDGIGCVWHPSLRTHARRAERLRAVLSEALGW